jgi:serine/threonine protein phosphatase PrpC
MNLTSGEKKGFEISGVISASLIPGRRRPEKHERSVGDAILIDLEDGILAVADSPDKNPTASSAFLSRFAESVSDSGILKSKDISFDDAIDRIVEMINGLLAATPYHDSTTFSAFISGDGRACGKAAILHTGDSLIFKIAKGKDEICEVTQLSRTNHLLVGRAPRLFQTEVIPFGPEEMILLITDGIWDISKSFGLATEKFLSNNIEDFCPNGIIKSIERLVDDSKLITDDIGIICAHPASIDHAGLGRTERENGRIILKG